MGLALWRRSVVEPRRGFVAAAVVVVAVDASRRGCDGGGATGVVAVATVPLLPLLLRAVAAPCRTAQEVWVGSNAASTNHC